MPKKQPFDLARRAMNSARRADRDAEQAVRDLEARDEARAARGRRSTSDLAEQYPALRDR